MATMKYWNGSAWQPIDANNGDSVDGIHFRVSGGKLQYSTNGSTWNNVGVDTSDTTASQANVLEGRYFYTHTGVRAQGTMPNHGDKTLVPDRKDPVYSSNGLNVFPALGYYNNNSSIRVYIGSQFDPKNVRKGVEFVPGMVGTGPEFGSGDVIPVIKQSDKAVAHTIWRHDIVDDSSRGVVSGVSGNYALGLLLSNPCKLFKYNYTTGEMVSSRDLPYVQHFGYVAGDSTYYYVWYRTSTRNEGRDETKLRKYRTSDDALIWESGFIRHNNGAMYFEISNLARNRMFVDAYGHICLVGRYGKEDYDQALVRINSSNGSVMESISLSRDRIDINFVWYRDTRYIIYTSYSSVVVRRINSTTIDTVFTIPVGSGGNHWYYIHGNTLYVRHSNKPSGKLSRYRLSDGKDLGDIDYTPFTMSGQYYNGYFVNGGYYLSSVESMRDVPFETSYGTAFFGAQHIGDDGSVTFGSATTFDGTTGIQRIIVVRNLT